jgi:hypothetical protein
MQSHAVSTEASTDTSHSAYVVHVLYVARTYVRNRYELGIKPVDSCPVGRLSRASERRVVVHVAWTVEIIVGDLLIYCLESDLSFA